jgi:hypothetical protein
MATVRWDNPAGGGWGTATNWKTGTAPGPDDTALIEGRGAFDITIGTSQSFEVGDVTLDATRVTLSVAGTLTLGSTFSLAAGALALDEGIIAGGTIEAEGGVFQSYGGQLDGVTFDGTLDLGSGQSLAIGPAGLISRGAGDVGAGSIDLTGGGSTLTFLGAQTLDDTGISLGTTRGAGGFVTLDAVGPLTLGAHATLDVVGLYGLFTGTTLRNDGVIRSELDGAGFVCQVTSFANAGAIHVDAGGYGSFLDTNFSNAADGVIDVGPGSTLDIEANTWSNLGAINVTHGRFIDGGADETGVGVFDIRWSTVWLEGDLTTSDLMAMAGVGDRFTLYGVLDNSGAVLTVGTGHALTSLTIAGTVEGGSLGGAGILFEPVGPGSPPAVLTNVTFRGELNLSAAGSGVMANGLTVTGAGGTGRGLVKLTGEDSYLDFGSTQTIDDVVIDLGAQTNGASVQLAARAVRDLTLTLGVGVRINQSGARAEILSPQGYGDKIINEGVIDGGVSGGQLVIAGDTFVNTGEIMATSGGYVEIGSYTFDNSAGGLILTKDADLGLEIGSGVWRNLGRVTFGDGSTIATDGTVDNVGTIQLDSTGRDVDLRFLFSGEQLSGGGHILLSDSSHNRIFGAALTNVDNRIVGAGQLGAGSMSLTNETKGVIEADFATALTIDTGASAVVNAGVLEAVGAGSLIVESALDNEGRVFALKGTVTLNGVVTGAGHDFINGGTMIAASDFSQTVTFGASGGVLELARSQGYAGTLFGFSKTGATTLDLGDIAFGAGTAATYSGTQTSGVLTVTDGTHTAKIRLWGDYLGSTFAVSSDGHGGTSVVDPPSGRVDVFVAAMAGLSPAAGPTVAGAAHQALQGTILARPGNQFTQ